METGVVVANTPSKVLDPKPRIEQEQSLCPSLASQQALPAASKGGSCQCKEATAASSTAAHEAHGDGISHESGSVNGVPPATEQHASMPCPAMGEQCSDAQQEADCPDHAAQPLPESAGEGKGKVGTHVAVAGLQWDLPEGVDLDDCLILWLGDEDAPALTQLMLTYSRYFPLSITMPEAAMSDQQHALTPNHAFCHTSGAEADPANVNTAHHQ